MATTDTSATAPGGQPVPAEPPAGSGGQGAAPEAGEATPPPGHRRRIVLLGIVVTLLVVVGALLAWYLTTRKPLSQLPGLSEEKPPHYLFSLYGSTQPLGVAVSPDGDRVYVTESGGQRVVRVYDRAGTQVGVLKPPASTGAAHIPVYVAVDPRTREVYVSDRQSASVYVYDADTKYLRTFTPRADVGAWAPLGLGFDPEGRLYVTDVRSGAEQRVLVFDRDGTLARTLVPPGGLTFPNGVVVDSRGDIEVSDSNNGRVLVFASDGSVVGRIVGGADDATLGLPRGLAVDDLHRLYIVDAANHGVRIYRVGSSPSDIPAYVASFGTEGTGDGNFEYPNGIAADSRARVYVTDRENNRVQVWTY